MRVEFINTFTLDEIINLIDDLIENENETFQKLGQFIEEEYESELYDMPGQVSCGYEI